MDLQIYFADEAGSKVAREVVPGVLVVAGEVDARLLLLEVVGLSVVPVGVGHRGPCLGTRTGRRDAPDERRLTRGVDALTSRPEVDALHRISRAAAQRRL